MNNNYSKKGLEYIQNKDKRISFLSILSSLMSNGSFQEDVNSCVEKAFEINEKIYVKYPFPMDTPSFAQKPVRSPNNASDSVLGSKPCPVCQSPMIRNDAGKMKNPKAPDWKCSKRGCRFKLEDGQWVRSDYITGVWDEKEEDTQRANHEDSVLADAQQNYAEELPPPEYR